MSIIPDLMTKAEACAYAAAIVDAEGYVTCLIRHGEKLERRLGFRTTNKRLFDFVLTIFSEMGIKFGVYQKPRAHENHAEYWIAYMVGGEEAYRRFQQEIVLRDQEKADALRQIIDDYDTTKAAGRKRRPYKFTRWDYMTEEERIEAVRKMHAGQRTPEIRAKASATQRAIWRTPEGRAKRSAVMKAAWAKKKAKALQ